MLFGALALLSLSSCNERQVLLDEVPSNTPNGAAIFVSGNFNNWNPSDQRFKMTLNQDSLWETSIPAGIGELEFKFTRGDWTSVETDACGRPVAVRMLNEAETNVFNVESWGDLDPENCPEVTIVVTDLPEDTPDNDPITIAGNFNDWQTDSFKLECDSVTGDHFITIKRPKEELRELEYVITRGSLELQEADSLGFPIAPRKLALGQTDTVKVAVSNWEDLVRAKSKTITVIIDRLPPGTDADAGIYMANSQNGWNPRDEHFRFKRNENGQLALTLPKVGDWLEYKITRGDWKKVEVDKLGIEIPNRSIQLNELSVERISIPRWLDEGAPDVNFLHIIAKVPENTPEKDKLYLVGDFNKWEGKSRWKLTRQPTGEYTGAVPVRFAYQEFKVTRGDWETQEVDKQGKPVSNRRLVYKSKPEVRITVDGWQDLFYYDQKVTVVLKSLPKNTGKNDAFYLASDLNNWESKDERYRFQQDKNGFYRITLKLKWHRFEYKITRGDWYTHECDRNGDDIENRVYDLSMGDQVMVDVVKWK